MKTAAVLAVLCLVAENSQVSRTLTLPATGVEVEQLDAAEILERMREAYATCSSYRDTGSVETVFVSDDRTRNVVKNFETAFVRPERFYFEYTERQEHRIVDQVRVREKRHVIWLNGEGASSWWTVDPQVEYWTDLGRAVAAARGVSSVTSTRVSSLLFPDIQWEDLLHVTTAAIVANEAIDGLDCWRMSIQSGRDKSLVWIDKESFLVRQVYEENDFPDHRDMDGRAAPFSTRTTTKYRPEIDVEIPEGRFEFEPPE